MRPLFNEQCSMTNEQWEMNAVPAKGRSLIITHWSFPIAHRFPPVEPLDRQS
jgi:hypothetical protein